MTATSILYTAPCGCQAYEQVTGSGIEWGVTRCDGHQDTEDLAPEIAAYFGGESRSRGRETLTATNGAGVGVQLSRVRGGLGIEDAARGTGERR